MENKASFFDDKEITEQVIFNRTWF